MVHIGPLAVKKTAQGQGLGKRLLDFAESLAPVNEIEVVECRTDVIPMYQRRGYREIRRIPITDLLEVEQLTREDLQFIIMQKSRDKSNI